MKILGLAAILVVLVLVVGLVGVPYLRMLGSGEVRRLCENELSAQLVSPASMHFPERGEAGYSAPERLGELWTWDGVVDSQNGFGAMLRSQFECLAIPKDDRAIVTVTEQ